MIIRPVGAELFRANRGVRRTDITKLTVVSRNLANAPKSPVPTRKAHNVL